MMIDDRFLYRQDPAPSLLIIARDGFRCRAPSDGTLFVRRAGEHFETESARRRGWLVPPASHMDCPRIYVYFNWKAITETTLMTGWLRIRLSRESSFLASDVNFYPEGSFSDPRVGYVVLPNVAVGDVIAFPKHIDVHFNGKWIPVSQWATAAKEMASL